MYLYLGPDSGKSRRRQCTGRDCGTGRAELQECGRHLEAAGSGFDKVFKTTCFLADMGDFAAFNEVYAKYFTSKPARSCVAVKTLPKGVLCEIEAIAVK